MVAVGTGEISGLSGDCVSLKNSLG
jgi:hypothetical protein